jgi:hypothetical protein
MRDALNDLGCGLLVLGTMLLLGWWILMEALR